MQWPISVSYNISVKCAVNGPRCGWDQSNIVNPSVHQGYRYRTRRSFRNREVVTLLAVLCWEGVEVGGWGRGRGREGGGKNCDLWLVVLHLRKHTNQKAGAWSNFRYYNKPSDLDQNARVQPVTVRPTLEPSTWSQRPDYWSQPRSTQTRRQLAFNLFYFSQNQRFIHWIYFTESVVVMTGGPDDS